VRLLYFFCGGCRIAAKKYDAERILNICMRYGFVYRNFRFVNDDISFECSLYTASLLEKICNDRKIEINKNEVFGLPKIISNYRKRIGILIGFVLICAITFISGRFVWDIRVSGCEKTNVNMIINELKSQNFRLGTYLPGIDVDIIENAVLINSPDISWIAINLKGTVAYVEIREKEIVPENTESNTPANLIASRDGLIEYFEISRGNTAVKIGQNVRKGDLLVSGIYESNVWGYGYMRPQGDVYARTVREISVEIPLKYQEKVYTGEEIVKKTLFFFSKPIKLYRNTGFLGETYDTINSVKNIIFFDGTHLPFSSETITYLPYIYEDRSRTQDEAIDLAYDELDTLIRELTEGGASLLRKNTNGFFLDDSYILDCNITLIENIAQISEFEVKE